MPLRIHLMKIPPNHYKKKRPAIFVIELRKILKGSNMRNQSLFYFKLSNTTHEDSISPVLLAIPS